jgi:predicted methyltransferase
VSLALPAGECLRLDNRREQEKTMIGYIRQLIRTTFGGLALVALALAPSGSRAQQSSGAQAAIAAAVSNPARPAEDRKADSLRKPAVLLAFSGVKPGDQVLELIPGRGYFTRLLSLVVGPKGHVFALVTAEEVNARAQAADPIRSIASDPNFGNVTVFTEPVSKFTVPRPVDLVWTTQNYHDLHDKAFGPADISAFNKAVASSLKPGGVFLVIDHAAAPGRGTKDTQTLHRIDPAAAKSEIEAAGFKLMAESDALKNPDDDHRLRIFDPRIRGRTDKFAFKFIKPH